ncbi:hypothetical protein IT408_04745 [Candidatus Uhrbacteria bacterium]|nr:hypothetical protein [Candidatus Uhrbacteria bacterium]
MDQIQRACLLRSLCFYEAIGYVPILSEWIQNVQSSSDFSTACVDHVETLTVIIEGLVADGTVRCVRGRYGFSEQVEDITRKIEERDQFHARKYRRARLVTRWLSFFSGVRFVALANTTAWGYASHTGDLDFFVIVRKGSIWQTRLFAVLPFKLLGWLPGPHERPDAVCLSYFVADDALDLTFHQISQTDLYYRHWFLALLPLYDDGISKELWLHNKQIRQHHPFARRWIVSPDLVVAQPLVRFPIFSFFEIIGRYFQQAWFPAAIRTLQNVDTRVIISDSTLKFHTDDARDAIYKKYVGLLQKYGLA